MKDSSTTTGPQTGPHIAISHSLPPAVSGEVRGELIVCVERLTWNYRNPPQQVQIRLRWWGAAADTVVPFSITRGAGAAFPLTSGPRYLSRYLKDMGSVAIAVEECPSGRTVGQIGIDVSTLDVCKPIEAALPLKGSNGQLLATADVSMRLRYSALRSSFEMNEHLASADKQLPLYPVPVLQQQAAKAVPEASNPAAVKEISVIAGVKEATRTSDTVKVDQQQVPAAKRKSLQAATAATKQAYDNAAPQASAAEQLQQCLKNNSAQQQAIVPAAAASTEPADPLLDIVRKAEQLKQAMDQAAQQGICLALPQAGGLFSGRRAATSLARASASTSGSAGSALSALQLLGLPSQTAAEQRLLQLHQQQLYGMQQGLPVPGSSGSIGSPQRSARTAAHPGLLAGGSSTHSAVGALPWSAAAASRLALAADLAGQYRHQVSPQAAAVLQLPLGSAAGWISTSGAIADSRSCSSRSSCSSSQISELEDLEEIEDLLLQELFNSTRTATGSATSSPAKSPKQQQEPLPDEGQHIPVGPAHGTSGVQLGTATIPAVAEKSPQATEQRRQQTRAASKDSGGSSSSSGPMLQVELGSLQEITIASTASPCVITAVIKSAGRTCCSLDATALLQTSQQQQQKEQRLLQTVDRCPCSAIVAGPACLSGPLLAVDKPCLVVELWCSTTSSSGVPEAVVSAATAAAAELLGIARVPLQQQVPDASSSRGGTMQLDQPCFASGTFQVYDVLRGKHSGSLELRVLLADTQRHSEAADPNRADAAAAEQTNMLSGEGSGGAAVVAVQHVFDVTVHSASHLPDQQQLQDDQQPVPEGRFMRYSFPDEEPLYTQEVPVVSSPTFSAHAQHTVVLPYGQSLSDCFACEGESAEQDTLQFEVFNKWEDDTDSLVASGSLPLDQVLQLSQVDHPATTQATACMRTFLVPLQLLQDSGEAAVQRPETALLLQVTISYSAVNCYSMHEVECNVEQAEAGPEQAAGGQAADELGASTAAAVILPSTEHMAAATATAAEEVPLQDSAGIAEVDVNRCSGPLQIEQPSYAASDLSSGEPLEAAHEEPALQQQDLATVDVAADDTVLAAQSLSAMAKHELVLHVQSAEGVHADSADAAADTGAARPQRPQYLSAELCVEVIRACGLQAAVKDAAHCLAGGSGLLGRAQQLGPHPYATVSLPFGSGSTSNNTGQQQVLKTPFQAQTFCPQFSHRQVVPLTLDGPTLSAIAAGDCTVDLYHHCPRSQAVAAALSRGQASSYVMVGQQQVLLGRATCPLQTLLIRPQGICSWLVLKSQLGQPVGAVQVALAFTHIGGTQQVSCPAAPSPVSRHPQLLHMLPDSFLQSVRPLLSASPDGFQGQLARITVHVEELLLPGGDEALERPKIANYVVNYRLPGSQTECHTHSKASSSQQSTSLLARSWHVDWQFCGTHWAVADWRLGCALQACPLHLSATKQEPSRRSGTGGTTSKAGGNTGSTAEDAVQLPVGVAEVDLSPLLLSRPGGARPNCRWLSGTFALVHPMCKNLGNMRLKVKVLLDLQPAEAPPKQLLADPVTFWQITGPLAAMQAPKSQANAAAVECKPVSQVATNLPVTKALAAAGRSKQAQTGDASTQTAAADDDVLKTSVPSASTSAAAALLVQEATATQGAAVSLHLNSGSSDAAGSAQCSTGVQQQYNGVAQAEWSAVQAADTALQSNEVGAAAASGAGPAYAQECHDMDAIRPMANRCSSRLRAEVRHVSAPGSTRSNSPETAPMHQQQQQQVQSELHALQRVAATEVQQAQLAAQQQQQQELGQGTAHVASVRQQPALQQLQQQLALVPQQQRWTDQAGMSSRHQLQLQQPGSMQDVCVCIEGVLNLQLPSAVTGWESCLYVSYDWNAVGAAITTPLVHARWGTFGHTASAKWFHSVCLPMAMQQQQQQQHSDVTCSSQDTAKSPSDVKLQVWMRSLPAEIVAELPPLYADVAAAPCDDDQLLGCATLDMSAMHMLGSIEGWYNVVDAAAQPRGQLKVSVTPLKQVGSPVRSSSHPGGDSHSAQTSSAAGRAVQPLPAISAAAATSRASSKTEPSLTSFALKEQGGQVLMLSAAGEDASAAVAGCAGDGLDPWHGTASTDEVPEPAGTVSVVVQDGLAGSDALLATLRANLQELDAVSASLSKRLTRSASPERKQACQGQITVAPPGLSDRVGICTAGGSSGNLGAQTLGFFTQAPEAAIKSSIMQQQQQAPAVTCPSAEAAARRAYAFRHVQTLSDDEEFMVAVGGVSESDTDTEELMGRVDWSLAQNSDEECYPGPPQGPPRAAESARQLINSSTAAESTATAAAGPATPLCPLNTDEWMFDISKPAAPAATSSGSRPAGPVNPAQLSQTEAAAATAAAAARLAAAEAARAVAATAQAAAEQRKREREAADETLAAAHASTSRAAAAAPQDVWQQLAELEDAEDEHRQQQQQQPLGFEVHDPRQLPEELEKRLDEMLSNFQAAASGPPPGAVQRPAAAAAARQPGGSDSSAAAAVSRALGLDNGDWDDDKLADISVDYSRHDHMGDAVDCRVAFANCLPPVQDDFVLEFSDGARALPAAAQQSSAAAGHGSMGAAGRSSTYNVNWDDERVADDGDPIDCSRHELQLSSARAGRVGFTNCLPPVQDDFEMEYNDGPQRLAGHVLHTAPAAARQFVQPPEAAPTLTAVQPQSAAVALSRDLRQPSSGVSSSRDASAWQHPAAVGVSVTAVAAASTSAAAAVGNNSSTAHDRNNVAPAFVPVIGDYNAALMDDMFSFSKSSASSSNRALPHPALRANSAASTGPQAPSTHQQHSVAAEGSIRTAAAAASSNSFVPVLGQYSEAGLDNMFSFRKSSSSSSNRSAGGSLIKHPGM